MKPHIENRINMIDNNEHTRPHDENNKLYKIENNIRPHIENNVNNIENSRKMMPNIEHL